MTEGSYIRGAGAVKVDPRRVGWILAVATLAVLAVATVSLSIWTASGNSRAGILRREGVPVQVTVTKCTGITSGIGMGVEYYECRGDYTLGGRTFNEVIHGSRSQLSQGQAVAALAIPGQPDSLGLPAAAGASANRSYAAPIVLGVITVAGAAGLLVWRRRSLPGRAPAAPTSTPV